MVKTSVFIFIGVTFIFLCFAVVNSASPLKKNSLRQQNNAPVVKIISPVNNSTLTPGVPVRYSITVSDKEDGESKYDEINPKEVLLEVKYTSDASTLAKAINKAIVNDAPGLAAMRTSNCFNCHGFDTKLIGPTFTDINKRYKSTAANIALLGKRIREGSTGIWGDVAMPTHPELTTRQIQDMVKWIMENASGNIVHYYIGTEGAFSLKLPPGAKNGAYIFTASYTDHGIDNAGLRLKGKDVKVMRVK